MDELPQAKDAPENDPLAEKWAKRIESAKKHWDKFHKRVRHNRDQVAGFDWSKDPKSDTFYKHRANLIHGTITAILPNIYARNPEISVTPEHQGRDMKLMCKTIEKVTNRYLEKGGLKVRGKSSVRAALTCSFGVVKVMYQRDIHQDPVIRARIDDTQDNIQRIEALLMQIEDPQERANQEAAIEELRQTQAALEEQAEVVASEGLVIDRVLTEHWLLDPAVAEFCDYAAADWMAQVIPMKRSYAEGLYGYKLDKAKTYEQPGQSQKEDAGRLVSGVKYEDTGDEQVCIIEIWDKQSQRVYTMAEGCKWWLREPYSPPKAGERWYPFFVLPFQVVDGKVIGPSLVDLTEKLQKEHNDARNQFVAHRDLCKPGWNASADVNEKTIRTYTDAVLGEVSILDTEGKPLRDIIVPKQHPPIDPLVYNTDMIRADWEQVSGMQDAARSTVVSPKTATEASIMQQSLSGRVSEFRDQVEDWLQEISWYAAQILLQELTPPQVERIMGPHKMEPMVDPMTGTPAADPATGQPIMVVSEPSYDWPELTKEDVFDLVQLSIRAGTTGEPDKIEQQETWIKVMPVIQPLIMQIMQVQGMGGDAEPLINLLRETLIRFDEKIDVDQFIPKPPQIPQQIQQPLPV